MKRIALLLLVTALTLGALGCSSEQGERAATGGDSIGTTMPPGTDTPADTKTGAVGRVSRVGQWNVMVVSAGPEGRRGRRTSPPGTSGRSRNRSAVLRVRVRLSHDGSRRLSVRPSDWVLEEGAAGNYRPLGVSKRAGNRPVRFRPGQRRTVVLRFSVPSTNGAYVLRFEPRQGGPGVLRVAIP